MLINKCAGDSQKVFVKTTGLRRPQIIEAAWFHICEGDLYR